MYKNIENKNMRNFFPVFLGKINTTKHQDMLWSNHMFLIYDSESKHCLGQ